MSLAHWSIDPPLGYLAVAYVVVSAMLYYWEAVLARGEAVLVQARRCAANRSGLCRSSPVWR